MILKPVIASYSGQTYEAISQRLDANALDVIATVAQGPIKHNQIDARLLDDLVEMHVLARNGDRIRLDTAVFLEDDIRAIEPVVSSYCRGLIDATASAFSPMRGEPPEVTNFLVGIVGIGQGLAHAQKVEGVVVDWKSYGGRYAHSKVDFNEVCDAFAATGQDLQSKTVFRGSRYSAVFIGPRGTNFLLRAHGRQSNAEAEFTKALNSFLTDAYAMLLLDELDSDPLRECADRVGLFSEGRPTSSVLTNKTIGRYVPIINCLTQITYDFAKRRLGDIRSVLNSTSCGRQGVPGENMMLNFWRFVRKGLAKQLYACGVLTDAVPETGLITVFFENEVEILNRLLD